MTKAETKQLGKWLIYGGCAGFIASVILSFTIYTGLDQGALPAASFLFLMLGLSFCFPSMLEVKENTISTMRVIVFAVVMVFALVYIKIGWSVGTLEEFTIDQNWVYILGLAFGGKVIQRYAEDDENNVDDTDVDNEAIAAKTKAANANFIIVDKKQETNKDKV